MGSGQRQPARPEWIGSVPPRGPRCSVAGTSGVVLVASLALGPGSRQQVPTFLTLSRANIRPSSGCFPNAHGSCAVQVAQTRPAQRLLASGRVR